MSTLRVANVSKSFGSEHAVHELDLSVPSGQIVAVLGPSGCGKTTLLRLIAGFEQIDVGTIELAGRLVSSPAVCVPPEQRQVGIVPQEGALFPHLSVERNVAFGVHRAARKAGRVEHVLSLVGLADYRNRMPHELSGGQQQRVAVARALAPSPALILLDEPFSALDAGLRADIRADVRQAILDDGATAVLVTHDQDEALSTADLVAVMRHGHIVQMAEPTTLYREPHDAQTARFVGEAIILDATIVHGKAVTALGTLPALNTDPLPADGPGTVLLRPEQIRIDATSPHIARVTHRQYFGHDLLLTVKPLLSEAEPLSEILIRVAPQEDHPLGSVVGINVQGPTHIFPADLPR